MIGSTIAHSRITAELGQGGTGEVHRARDDRSGHLLFNWLMTIFATGTGLLAVAVWVSRLWSTPARIHFTLVAASGLYLLYLLVVWDALILWR